MKSKLSLYRDLIPILLGVVCILLMFVPFKLGVISFSDFKNYKSSLEAISAIVTILFIIIGGTFSYIRFFKGRIFTAKIDLELKAGIIKTGDKYTHWIEISIINKGNIAIWNYTLQLFALPHSPNGEKKHISNCIIDSSNDKYDFLIDVGESAFEQAIIELDKNHLAYTFEAIVSDEKGTMWRRFITVSNCE